MAYVAVSGGEDAIEASIRLLDYYRSGTGKDLEIDALVHKFGLLIDKVMSESGLYAKEYAALALKQCEGSPEEAVFLLRSLIVLPLKEVITQMLQIPGKCALSAGSQLHSRTFPADRCLVRPMITLIVLSTLSLRMKMPQSCIKSFKKSLQNRRRKSTVLRTGFRYAKGRGAH